MTKKEAKTVEIVEKDFEQWLKLAQLGDVKAQLKVGAYYYSIKRTKDNKEKAFNWFMEAAKQENARAQLIVGLCYSNGKGVEENKKEAFEWYKKAAEQGDEIAQFYVGMYYYKGKNDVEQNFEEAFKWFLKAAEQGYVNAQFNTGCCYNKGNGIKANKEEAFKWFLKAAEQGHVNAQFNVGCCYNKGDGIKANKEEAFKWFIKAAEQGHEKAKSIIESYNNNKYMKNKITTEQDNKSQNEIDLHPSILDQNSMSRFESCIQNNTEVLNTIIKIIKTNEWDTKMRAGENQDSSKVFIIYGGRDVAEAKRRELKEILKDKFQLQPIVLCDEADQGNTIIEKFEYYAKQCSYAFAIFTPEDIVSNNGKEYLQVRPNVIFELGWFYAHLGRSKVCILNKQKGTKISEIFSDLQGIVFVTFENNISETLEKIRQELKAAGIL